MLLFLGKEKDREIIVFDLCMLINDNFPLGNNAFDTCLLIIADLQWFIVFFDQMWINIISGMIWCLSSMKNGTDKQSKECIQLHYHDEGVKCYEFESERNMSTRWSYVKSSSSVSGNRDASQFWKFCLSVNIFPAQLSQTMHISAVFAWAENRIIFTSLWIAMHNSSLCHINCTMLGMWDCSHMQSFKNLTWTSHLFDVWLWFSWHLVNRFRTYFCVFLFASLRFVTISCAISWLLRIWYRWINKNIMVFVSFSIFICIVISSSHVCVCVCMHLVFINYICQNVFLFVPMHRTVHRDNAILWQCESTIILKLVLSCKCKISYLLISSVQLSQRGIVVLSVQVLCTQNKSDEIISLTNAAFCHLCFFFFHFAWESIPIRFIKWEKARKKLSEINGTLYYLVLLTFKIRKKHTQHNEMQMHKPFLANSLSGYNYTWK